MELDFVRFKQMVKGKGLSMSYMAASVGKGPTYFNDVIRKGFKINENYIVKWAEVKLFVEFLKSKRN